MTPEEKFNQDAWLTLQAIRQEQLSTPSGENVKINTSDLTNRGADYLAPTIRDIAKSIRKLEGWGVFKVVKKYDADSYDPYEFVESDWDRANEFILSLNHPKFNELYGLYENGLKISIEPKRLLELVREWAHPTGKDEILTLEIWEIIKGKKKTVISTDKNKEITNNDFDWGKLKIFREKVGNATVFDDNFRRLVGIELFDYIHENTAVKNEFEGRLNYLKNLADDSKFKLLQDDLFKTIQKILKLTSLREVQEKQREWDNGKNALINKLKSRSLTKDGAPDFLTLPDLYLALQDQNNYYRLGERSYFSPMEGEISTVTHIVPVKKQYEVNVEGFFRLVFFNKFINNEKGQKQFDSLINEYNQYWYKLDELIYRTPIKLHFQSFERFFFDCVKFYPRQGYEFYHSFLGNSVEQKTEKEFKKTKENAIVVIDDLIEALEVKEGDKKEVPQMQVAALERAVEKERQKKLDEIIEKFGKTGEKIELKKPNESSEKMATPLIPEKYKISVKDREIWVNDYVIGKPHAVGNNFEFFDYVRHQPPNTQIEWRTIPDKVGWEMMKKAIRGRRFIKILNALGFKSEIKKAFFYKVGIDTLYYKGDEITKEDLEKAGVKIPLFLKELEVAHTKIVPNSPI